MEELETFKCSEFLCDKILTCKMAINGMTFCEIYCQTHKCDICVKRKKCEKIKEN